MDFSLFIAVMLLIIFVGSIAQDSAKQKRQEKARKKAETEQYRRYRSDSTLVHSDALRTYIDYLDDQKKDFAGQRQSAAISELAYKTGSLTFYRSELRNYIWRSGEVPPDWKSASEMQRALCQAIARDKTLNRSQMELLTNNVASALKKHLAEEAEMRAREEQKRRAEESEHARRAKAAQERIEGEQRLLTIRLKGLYSPAWNKSAGRLPVEDALKTELPNQRCLVYRVDVGGESYVGYTTATPKAAMEEHESQSRRGSMAPLHKALRRFGYVYETEILAENEDEVHGLLARLVQLNKIKPALNRSFEGEGEQFDLIEKIDEFGGKILYVENKKVCRVHDSLRRRSDPEYLRSVLQKIQRRYAKIEEKYGVTSSSTVADAHSKTWAGPAKGLSSSDVVAFAREKREALAALKNGHQAEQ